jgi:small subunit ribosomal protein S10
MFIGIATRRLVGSSVRVVRRDFRSIPCRYHNSSKVQPRRSSGEYVDDTENYRQSDMYPSEGSYVQSSARIAPGTGRPVPINVQMNNFAPFKHKISHGVKVADVHLRSYTTQNLDFYGDFLLRVAFYLKIPVKGVSPLPSRTQRWTVIRSPFAHAKSKENFQRITHKRAIQLYDANPEVVQVFLATAREYSITGVGIKAVLYNRESLDVIEKLDSQPTESVSPLSVENIDLNSADSEVARAVLEILEDPAFKTHMEKSKESKRESV